MLPFLSIVTDAELRRNPTVKSELDDTGDRPMSTLPAPQVTALEHPAVFFDFDGTLSEIVDDPAAPLARSRLCVTARASRARPL